MELIEDQLSCDVLIIGAGMAGGCLARQLKLEHPDLDIIVVDQKKQFDWWVGESCAEPFDDYAVRVLQLGPYLMRHHLPKHSLRFFFDSPSRDLAIDEMSEIGRGPYAGSLQSYQLDRSRFDMDLCEMNRASGIRVLLGTRVLGRGGELAEFIKLDSSKGHTVRTSAGTISCKWLVDAAGRSSPLCELLGLVPEEVTRDPRGSYWGRFANYTSLDHLGTNSWRARVDYSMRLLSTNHFMYKGYWIWHIPVDDKILSLGVTFDRGISPIQIKNAKELEAFLRSHKALDQILGPSAECKDFMGLKFLNRCANEFFSEDRWFLTGMSAMFVDPLFSTGSVILAFMNRFISEIIRADRAGDATKFRRRVRNFNRYMRGLYRSIHAAMDYRRFGSFDAYLGFHTGRFQTYWNQDVASQLNDFAAYIKTVDAMEDDAPAEPGRELDAQAKRSSGVVGAIDRLTDEFVAYVDGRDLYYARNRGCFFENSERPSLRKQAFTRAPERASQQKENGVTYEAVFRHFLSRICEIESLPFSESRFAESFKPDWRHGQTLAEVLSALKRAPTPADAGVPPRVRWTPKGPIDPDTPRALAWEPYYLGPDGTSLV